MIFLKRNTPPAAVERAGIFTTWEQASRQVDRLLAEKGQAASISRCLGGWMVRIVRT